MTYSVCCNDKRRAVLATQAAIKGIDFVEVSGDGKTVFIHFFAASGRPVLTPANIRIEGGVRIRDVHITGVSLAPDPLVTNVTVDSPGDFSPYMLKLVDSAGGTIPGLDPVFSEVEFFFRPECLGDHDCQDLNECPPEPRIEPSLDYLAKDYASFRRLMLDRMALLSPEWTERSPADLGIALVEMLAYVGDRMSYRQDAIATEAYIRTARDRISVRRHARLVDYAMHDGANARVWVQVKVRSNLTPPTAGLSRLTFLTKLPGFGVRLENTEPSYHKAVTQGAYVFEAMHPVGQLFADHNEMTMYTWGSEECHLPTGSTGATLLGNFPNLKVGDVVIFFEKCGPQTGRPQDADPKHRHAVRITKIESGEDTLGTELWGVATFLTHIQWSAEDALPFPVCVSARTEAGLSVPNVSVVLGNIVLCDHGQTLPTELLDRVPAPQIRYVGAHHCGCGDSETPDWVIPSYRPKLSRWPVTQQPRVRKANVGPGQPAPLMPFDPAGPAQHAFSGLPSSSVPEINLEDLNLIPWTPTRDLLFGIANSTEFVLEVDNASIAHLRFGDGINGRRPTEDAEQAFTAKYRVGNGAIGNIPADAIGHVVSGDNRIDAVWNPMGARGGVDPESMEEARRDAPIAFQMVQQRAVTEADYAEFAKKHPLVQNAVAIFRWTGSWRTVFIAVDLEGNQPLTADVKTTLLAYLDQYRMAGHDLEVIEPTYVPLNVEIDICVAPHVHKADVVRRINALFQAGIMADGSPAIFNPDRMTFSQKVYLSPIYALAQSVDGVEAIRVSKFERLGTNSNAGLNDGFLAFGKSEIPRLDNDPNFPDRGIFRAFIHGGSK